MSTTVRGDRHTFRWEGRAGGVPSIGTEGHIPDEVIDTVLDTTRVTG
jgi:hypothetical protein